MNTSSMNTEKVSGKFLSGMLLLLLCGLLVILVCAMSAHGQTSSPGHPTKCTGGVCAGVNDALKCAMDYCLDSVSLTASSVVGGNSVEGRVTMLGPVSYDIEVTLAADPPLVVEVPTSVTVKAGEQSAAFTVTVPVSKSVVIGSDNVVGIYANYGVTKHVDLTILAPVSFDRMIDRVIAREHSFIASVKTLHPLAETYIQNMQEDKEHNVTPTGDQYFLGRLDLSASTEERVFEKDKPGTLHHILSPFEMLGSAFQRHYVPRGFANMAILDRDFQKNNYYFNFVRQEFLGEIRCIVVDVQPREHAPKGLFSGRIWVEDKEFNIIRFNGTYANASNYESYFHFDSWRVNMQPGLWLPAYVYSEETNEKRHVAPFKAYHFKAQTRFWDYDEARAKHQSEFTDIKIDDVQDNHEGARLQAVPVEAQRNWERLAEDNAIDHLQKIGLISPPGPVDKVLQTVVNNLIITNQLDIAPDVRCRVLLTTPIESFTIGHTIVVSRGLIDVLPDEPALAMLLSHELAHIALAHKIDTRFAFNDRFFFRDSDTFQRLDFGRSQLDEQAADAKALQLLNNSPYKDKLVAGGLFLKQVQERTPVLANLISPHLGNPLSSKSATRLAPVATAAPQLEKKVDQIAALSLGARINVDPWSNQIVMMSPKHVTLLSPGEKMPLEVTPFSPYLTRMDASHVGETGKETVKEAAKR